MNLCYTYDPAGNVSTMNQGFYALSYGYDGADQLVSETNTGGNPTPNYGYSYDKNGNRLTMTTNGAQSQSFTYDGHDKLTSGTAGAETDGYDLNGNQTGLSLSGGTSTRTFDDEDRLVRIASGSFVDTFTYNGLGLRVGKTDSTGTYLYVCDGTSPGSPVLIDGHTLYTPGLSENHSGASSFYDFDRLGNLWTLDSSSNTQLGYEDFTGFGSIIAQAGSVSPSGFGGGSGCLTDTDLNFVLMGHRYYDSRQGRFISQDPAGDGDNWYAYADNSPTNEIDPEGLMPMDGPGSSPLGSPGYNDVAEGVSNIENFTGASLSSLGYWSKGVPVGQMANGQWYNQWEADTNWVSNMDGPMIAASPVLSGGTPGPEGTLYRQDFKEKPVPDMHVVHSGGETNITHRGGYRRGIHRGQRLVPLPRRLRPMYRDIIKDFMKKSAKYVEAELDAFGESFGRSQLNGAGAGEAAEEQAAME